MTTNYYIIDTSSLVKLNRNNPLDVFPSIWKNLEKLVLNNQLIAPKEVLNEIIQNDDQLTKWAKNQKGMFIEPTEKQIGFVKDILKEYPSILDIDRKNDADPWVIALALEMMTDPQKKLFSIKRIVVTEEKLRGNKIKIPFICENKSIESIDIITLFRIEGWKF
jgi:hypothetical protein